MSLVARLARSSSFGSVVARCSPRSSLVARLGPRSSLGSVLAPRLGSVACGSLGLRSSLLRLASGSSLASLLAPLSPRSSLFARLVPRSSAASLLAPRAPSFSLLARLAWKSLKKHDGSTNPVKGPYARKPKGYHIANRLQVNSCWGLVSSGFMWARLASSGLIWARAHLSASIFRAKAVRSPKLFQMASFSSMSSTRSSISRILSIASSGARPSGVQYCSE